MKASKFADAQKGRQVPAVQPASENVTTPSELNIMN
jgi:hypothetical protein